MLLHTLKTQTRMLALTDILTDRPAYSTPTHIHTYPLTRTYTHTEMLVWTKSTRSYYSPSLTHTHGHT